MGYSSQKNGAGTDADQGRTLPEFRGSFDSRLPLGMAEAVSITGLSARKLREIAPIIPGTSKGLSPTNTPVWQFDEPLLRGWVADTVAAVQDEALTRALGRKFPCDFYMNRWDMAAYPNRPNRVYFIGCESGHIKIGLAFNPKARRMELQAGCPLELKLLAERAGSRQVEMYLHEFYKAERVRGEWFLKSERLESYIERLNKGAESGLMANDASVDRIATECDLLNVANF